MIAEVEKLFATVIETLNSKSNDYASTEDPFKNLNNASVLGTTTEIGIGVRVLDKLTRAFNLINGKKRAVLDEKVTDTIIDIIGYMALLYVYLKRKKC